MAGPEKIVKLKNRKLFAELISVQDHMFSIPVIQFILMMRYFVNVKKDILVKSVIRNAQILARMDLLYIKTENVNVFVINIMV